MRLSLRRTSRTTVCDIFAAYKAGFGHMWGFKNYRKCVFNIDTACTPQWNPGRHTRSQWFQAWQTNTHTTNRKWQRCWGFRPSSVISEELVRKWDSICTGTLTSTANIPSVIHHFLPLEHERCKSIPFPSPSPHLAEQTRRKKECASKCLPACIPTCICFYDTKSILNVCESAFFVSCGCVYAHWLHIEYQSPHSKVGSEFGAFKGLFEG